MNICSLWWLNSLEYLPAFNNLAHSEPTFTHQKSEKPFSQSPCRRAAAVSTVFRQLQAAAGVLRSRTHPLGATDSAGLIDFAGDGGRGDHRGHKEPSLHASSAVLFWVFLETWLQACFSKPSTDSMSCSICFHKLMLPSLSNESPDQCKGLITLI